MMKKNILVILIVIGVIGVVAYLLKDKLRVLLGERVKGEVIPGEIEIKKGIIQPGAGWFGLKRLYAPELTMATGITLAGESPARWLQEEIAPLLQPLYPVGYKAIVKGLFAYLVKGEDEGTIGITLPEFPANGPYSYGLPQF